MNSSRIGILIAVGSLLIVGIAWYIAFSFAQTLREEEQFALQQARQAQIESCERVNVLREEVNSRVHILDTMFANDPIYNELPEQLELVEVPNCEEVVPRY